MVEEYRSKRCCQGDGEVECADTLALRKTGVVLQDGGERDEHGMQPLESIFSPHEEKPASGGEHESSDGAGSGEMEIASSECRQVCNWTCRTQWLDDEMRGR